MGSAKPYPRIRLLSGSIFRSMKDCGFFEFQRESYQRYIPLHMGQCAGTMHQPMNSNTYGGGNHHGIGIGVN
jgi:hypothetical protein